MEKVELRFLRITYSHTHAGAYALILGEAKGDRRLPIIIGGVEAQAIAIQVENIKPARPLTHDLFQATCEPLGVNLKEVIINDLVEGIFHAKLVMELDGKTAKVDARSSDAIALALRFDCPIFTYEFILSAAGLKVEEGDEDVEEDVKASPDDSEGPESMSEQSVDDLRTLLEEALNREDYELASVIRDEIKKREQKN